MKNRSVFLTIVSLSLCFLYGTCVPSMGHAAPPSRVYDYTPLTTIQSDQVEANENAIFGYLQAGVETIKEGVITNADVSGSAAITASKVDLSTVAQDISNTGTLSNVGAFTVTGDVSIMGDVRDLGTLVVTGASTFSSTLSTGALTASSLALSSGDTVVSHIGAETQGDIIIKGASKWQTLPIGTTGYFLKSNGAGANPSWVENAIKTTVMDRWTQTTQDAYGFSAWSAPASATIKNLYVHRTAANDSTLYTIYKNGVATALTATMGAVTTVSDTAHSFTVVAGDTVSMEVDATNPTTNVHSITYEVDF
jgi:hypothetical protein